MIRLEGLCALVAFATTVSLLPGAINVLRRLGVMDKPIWRSLHSSAVPLGAGVVMVLGAWTGFGAAVLFRHSLDVRIVASSLISVTMLAVVGLTDDVRNLDASVRLFAQAFVGLVLAFSLQTSGPKTAFIVVATLVFANTFNFMDGVNGMAGVHGLLFFGAIGYAAHSSTNQSAAILAALGAGACLGFLPFNVPRARVFMGDVGAYGMATLAVAALAQLAIRGDHVEAPLAAWFPFLAEVGVTLAARIYRRADLGQGHREHSYQRLVAMGWSQIRVVALYAAASVLTGLLGLLTLKTGKTSAQLITGATILVATLFATALKYRTRLVPVPEVPSIRDREHLEHVG